MSSPATRTSAWRGKGPMLLNITLFLLIVFITSVVSLAIKHDEPRKIFLGSLKLFAMIVGGILLFCIVVQVLQASV